MSKPRRILFLAALLLAVFGFGTWGALEISGVAVVTTTRETGEPRATHLWYVEDGGVLWLEAGTPDNSWFADVGRDPLVTFAAEDRPAARHRAVPVPERSAAVRAQLRRKYGWRDRWVGLFVDSSRSLAVRLDPVPPGPP